MIEGVNSSKRPCCCHAGEKIGKGCQNNLSSLSLRHKTIVAYFTDKKKLSCNARRGTSVWLYVSLFPERHRTVIIGYHYSRRFFPASEKGLQQWITPSSLARHWMKHFASQYLAQHRMG